jgi:predicted Ser/Thr protein kinase/tetratricopeptide (TPR) repeat protein
MPFNAGENVGPYRIIEQLGQGGMATVHKAYHPALDRYVAIKALHPAFMEDPSFLERFKREARVVAKLDHPNIVPIFDFAEHSGQPYLVMKFVEGKTLKFRLSEYWPNREEMIAIVEAVGSALAYAHQRGILHRDIKPSNVLMANDNQVYLADFGLARIAEAGQSTLSGDMMLGTPHYISPEQARGERDLDEGTDIYSLGIVLYELAVGRVPFNSDTPFSIIHDHIYTALPVPRQVNPKVPEIVERVLLKSLAKDREDRYRTVGDLVEDFKAAAMGMPTSIDDVPTAVAAAAPIEEKTRQDLVQEEKTEKRPRRWAWILSGLAFSAVCLFLFMANVGDAESQPILPQEDVPVLDASAPEVDVPTSSVTKARERVNRNPGDAQARIDLAHALFNEGLDRAAHQELLIAGEILLEQEAYFEAAEALTTGIETTDGIDLRRANLLTQALFLGAPTLEMFQFFEVIENSVPDWEPLPALAARSLLFAEEIEEAENLLKPLLEERPGDALARAVIVDFFWMQGDADQAIAVATELLGYPRMLPWLQAHLEHTIESIEVEA